MCASSSWSRYWPAASTTHIRIGTPHATREPNREQLVGTWLATEETLNRLRLPPQSLPRLEIGEDGSIVMKGVPTGWRDGSLEVGATVEDFAGQWSLQRHQDAWWGLSIRQSEWACYGCLMVMHDKAPHRLVLRYGDPDEGLGLEFERGRRTRG